MLRSTRAALAVGLGCVGVAGLVGQSVAQQDARVQKVAAASTGTGATAPVAMPAGMIGTIDVEGVFREYDKVKVTGETLNAEVMVRYNELTKLANEGKQEQEKLGHMSPTSPDRAKIEDRMVQLQANIEAGRKNAEREFTQKETEMMTSIYNEVTDFAKYVAKKQGMSFVVKYTDGKVQGTEPNSAMSAMSKTIIYADPNVDITKKTIELLNQQYKANGGRAPRNPNPAANPTGAGTPAPASRTTANPGVAAPR